MLLFNKKIIFQIRRYSHSNVHLKILQDAFGLAVPEANKFLRNIRQTNTDKFSGCIKMCRNLGFSDEEILEYPGLLNGPPMILEQHFMTLEEGGFHTITPYILLKYRKFFSKSIKDLKTDHLIKKEVNVAKSFASYFDPQPDANVMNYDEFTDDQQWRDVHYRLLKMYLKWRLQATSEEIDLLFRIHHMVHNKSVRLLCENIHLALEVGLTLRRIVKSGYILHSYPKYTKEVLRDFHNIAGGDLKKAILGCPKLFMVSPKNYAKIYGILKEHNISDETIRNQLNIFQLSPQTVKYRLEEIENTPELNILKHNVNFLKLVVHHQRAKSRLSFLQELQMKCLPLSILSMYNSNKLI
ncbi:hypothetical protein WA026_003565 [Henosepilachna vigintioctopunctata]|uniref:Uncharacterized protein n=1 Tax=Henosepilachna vigintioctopunctata TaxID=420089 RepID=A0AAW1TIK0_9CUCU